jgi:hypothetical protein
MAPTTAPASRKVTPLAALFNVVVKADGQPDLPTYLAVARTPGAGWQSYDQIAAYLSRLTGQPVNRVTVKNITEGTYRLPNTRYWDGHSQPRAVDAAQFERYETALIDTPADVAYVTQANAEAVETAAIVGDPDTMSAVADGEADLAAGRTVTMPDEDGNEFDGDRRYRSADGTADPEA